MGPNEYQLKVTRVKKYTENPALYLLAKLTEESGEVAKEIVRREEGQSPKLDLNRELGDVLWVVSAIGEHYGISLEDIMKGNISKLEERNLL